METKNANGRPYCKYFVCGATCKFGAEKCKGAHDEEYRKEYGKLVSQAKDIAVQKRNMKEQYANAYKKKPQADNDYDKIKE